jgi:hypothetical protein
MKASFDLDYCHGITHFSTNVDFDSGPMLVFAPNGTFKSSFRKTIEELISNNPTSDVLYPSNKTNRTITIDGKPATADDFFVFKNDVSSEDFAQSSGNFLANSMLKSQYDKIIVSYARQKQTFLAKVSDVIGKKIDIEAEIQATFMLKDTDTALIKMHKATLRMKKWPTNLSDYKKFFSKNPLKFIQEKDTQKSLIIYSTAYRRSVIKSPLFKRGIFEIGDLDAVATALEEKNYFAGGNEIKLAGYSKTITTVDDLKAIVAKAFEKASKDPEVVKQYQKLTELGAGKDYANAILKTLETSPSLGRELSNPSEYRKKLLLAAMHSYQADFNNLMKTRGALNKSIKAMNKAAKAEEKDWERTFRIIKDSFGLQLEIKMQDPSNVIYKTQVPTMSFAWRKSPVDANTLINEVLSAGEKRAFDYARLYFDILSFAKKRQRKIIVFDDVADSFDYANKHAIVEFLYNISKLPDVYMIILTHNFDFFRLVGGRVMDSKPSNCFFAVKDPSGTIGLKPGQYFRNIFQNYLVANATPMHKPAYALSLVTFGRAIIELSYPNFETDPDYLLYTKAIHYRSEGGAQIRCSTLYRHLHKQIFGINRLLQNDPASKTSFYKAVQDECRRITADTTIDILIEDKLALAIGLRILSEHYMYNLLLKKKFITQQIASKMEIGKLFDLFERKFPNNKNLSNLRLSKIFCPPDIHLNSFMFEPIVDYDISRMRRLYIDLWSNTPKYCHC